MLIFYSLHIRIFRLITSILFIHQVLAFKAQHPGVLESWRSTEEGIQLYAEITNDIRKAVLKLEAEAWNRSRNVAELKPGEPSLAF